MCKIEINKETCIGCGSCLANCPLGAIIMNEDGVCEINKETCGGCGTCIKNCPTGSIKEIESK